MKLVMEYKIGDDCTWWATDVVPFEYESIDKFLYDLMEACLNAVNTKTYNFTIIGREFNYSDFGYFQDRERQRGYEFTEPTVKTLEDWFDNNIVKV